MPILSPITTDQDLFDSLESLEDFCKRIRIANAAQDHEEIKFLSFNMWEPLGALAYIAGFLDDARQE